MFAMQSTFTDIYMRERAVRLKVPTSRNELTIEVPRSSRCPCPSSYNKRHGSMNASYRRFEHKCGGLEPQSRHSPQYLEQIAQEERQ
jgi:hypothetical protein